MKRILLVNVAAAEEGDGFVENMLLPAWKKNFAFVRDSDTEIVSRHSRWGIHGLEGFFYNYLDVLNSQAVFQAALHAEEEGFDAVIVMCFGDPMLRQIRQAVNVPVIGLGETAMLWGVRMCAKFGIIAISEHNINETIETVEKYGLSHRLAGVRAIKESPEAQGEALISAEASLEAFREVSLKLIGDGADLIIPGCGIMSPAMRLMLGVESLYPQGLSEVDGVPVLDVLSCALATAQATIEMRRAGSTWISRSGLYVQATESAMRNSWDVVKDGRITFWDCEI